MFYSLNLNSAVQYLLLLTVFIFFLQNVLFVKSYDVVNTFRFAEMPNPSLPYNQNKIFIYLMFAAILVLSLYPTVWQTNSDTGLSFLLTNFNLFESAKTPITLYYNELSTSFTYVTLVIGYTTNLFAYIYMYGEPLKKRFLIYLNMFLFSMVILLNSGNWIVFLLSWELIGLFSYLLINFWNVKITPFKAALKAMCFNQISDAFLLVAIIIYQQVFFSFNIPTGLSRINECGSKPILEVMVVFFFISACCKSAQFPFHFWLPDSMEAPVPASALIHSATLVSAGIYLTMLIKPMFMYLYWSKYFILTLPCLTIIIASLNAVLQTDMKKILAFSTITNCSYLLIFSIFSTTKDCFQYFYMHGLLKALAFFCVGIVILQTKHKQDLRYINNVSTVNTVTIITLAALGAMPLTIVNFTKHNALGQTYSGPTLHIVNAVLLFGSLMSQIYTIKLIYLLFFYKAAKVKFSENYHQRALIVLLATPVTYVLLTKSEIMSPLYYTKSWWFLNGQLLPTRLNLTNQLIGRLGLVALPAVVLLVTNNLSGLKNKQMQLCTAITTVVMLTCTIFTQS